jgi:hypothetical protein
LPPDDDGAAVAGVEPETVVFAPPDAETVPGKPDASGEPPGVGVLPAAAEPPDGDVAVDDPACVVVSEVESVDPVESLEPAESLEPGVSARATSGVEAIAAPTPSATASAPTRPT